MDVFVANEQDLPVDVLRVSKLARHALSEEGIENGVELSVLFITSDHMKRLNDRFAGNNYATDVLAFPMAEEEESPSMLGDVVICPEVAQQNATGVGHDLAREIDTLLVHGTLHLLGYDHQGEADTARMNSRLSDVLESFEAHH